jgi:ribosomal protein S18 acetylase RimI-like enzyme
MSDPTIRPARPEDVDAAVPLIFSSGPDAFNFVLSHKTPMNAQEFLAAAYVTGKGEFGFPDHWVVEDNGEVVALAAGYTGTTASGFLLPAVVQCFRFNGLLGGLGVVRRGLQIEKHIVPPKGPDEFYIAHVGVAPERRGQGLGGLLLDLVHDEGRRQGAKVAALDVSVENPRAEALYTRMGYQVVELVESELRNDAGYVPHHRRMELPLVP